MKKLLIAILLSGLSTTVAQAQFSDQKNTGGFKGPGLNVSTVKQALEMKDDTPVLLKGNIEQSLGDEKYLFKDSTGTIIVEIDKKRWKGQEITPADTVEISGEVDKELFSKAEVDVKTIKKTTN